MGSSSPDLSNNESSVFLSTVTVIAMLALVVFGSVLRFGDQATKDFWVDEVWRAQQIVHADNYGTLQDGEYFGIEAPVHYVEFMLGKMGLEIFGQTELAFRIWPLLFSVTSLLLFWLLVQRELPRTWAVMALALFACSPGMIEHAHEFKPYSFETALFLFVLCWITLLRGTTEVKKQFIIFSALGFVSILCSNIWPFVWAILVIEFFTMRISTVREAWSGISGSGKVALAMVFVGFLAFASWMAFGYLQSLQENKIFSFWSPYYLDTLPKIEQAYFERFPETLHWYVTGMWGTPPQGVIPGSILLVVVFVLAPWSLASLGSSLAVPYFVLFIVQIILALLGVFPIFTRVGAFSYPLFCIGIAAVGALLTTWIPPRLGIRVSALVVIGLLGWGAMQFSYPDFPGRTRHVQRITPLLQKMEDAATASIGREHLLFPNYSARLALQFYDVPEGVTLREHGVFPDKEVADIHGNAVVRELEQEISPNTVVWILSSHRISGAKIYRRAFRKAGYDATLYQESGAYLLRVTAPS